jgi:hypothetical protein
MRDRPTELDMTIEGEFRTPPRPPKPPMLNRILVWAVLIAVLAGSLAIAADALWLALIILPVALGAAVIAWAIYRYQVWRAGGSVRGMQGGGNVWRP